jgi:hypothetical protein
MRGVTKEHDDPLLQKYSRRSAMESVLRTRLSDACPHGLQRAFASLLSHSRIFRGARGIFAPFLPVRARNTPASRRMAGATRAGLSMRLGRRRNVRYRRSPYLGGDRPVHQALANQYRDYPTCPAAIPPGLCRTASSGVPICRVLAGSALTITCVTQERQ